MVVTGAVTAETGVMHERVGWPPRCTVQHPHWPMPHPYLVPRMWSTSRSTQRRGVSPDTSTVTDRPFTVRWIAIIRLLLRVRLCSASGKWDIRGLIQRRPVGGPGLQGSVTRKCGAGTRDCSAEIRLGVSWLNQDEGN